jgi:hypothetical protein
LPRVLAGDLGELIYSLDSSWRIVLINPPLDQAGGKRLIAALEELASGEGACEVFDEEGAPYVVVARREWGQVEQDLQSLRTAEERSKNTAMPAVADALRRYVIEEPKELRRGGEASKPDAGGEKKGRRDEFGAAAQAPVRGGKAAASMFVARGSADGFDGVYACQRRRSAASSDAAASLDPWLQERVESFLSQTQAATWLVLINPLTLGDTASEYAEMIARLVHEGEASDSLVADDGVERGAIVVVDWANLNKHKEKLRARSKAANRSLKLSIVDAFRLHRVTQPAALLAVDTDTSELDAKKLRSSFEAAATLSQLEEITRAFEAERLELLETFIFGEARPTKSLMRRFLKAYAGAPVSDDERRLIGQAIRVVCRSHQWQLVVQAGRGNQVKKCLVEVVSSGGSGMRFRARGVNKGEYFTSSQTLPPLDLC